MNKLVLSMTVAIMLAVMASATLAETITSSTFSLGYGFAGSAWSTTETSGSNTATTIGDFTFSPTVSGAFASSYGPTFPARVLTDGIFGSMVGQSDSFGVSIAGSWTGDTPADAAADPNYQIRINITDLKIWAVAYDHVSIPGTDIAFEETTVGHTDTSAYITDLIRVGSPGLESASNYKHLTWNPDDYQTSGTSFTRTFGLASTYRRIVDGFEVEGTVDLIYTVVPEPSSLVLLALGLVGFVGYALKRRKRRA